MISVPAIVQTAAGAAQLTKPAPGMTTTAWFVAATIPILGAIFVALIRNSSPMRKLRLDADSKLRDDLLARVEKLEKMLDHKDAIHNAERALDRHKINNLTQCFDAVMLMLEAAPERVGEIVTKVKAMREAQIKAEAVEKAAIHAAEIRASSGDEA